MTSPYHESLRTLYGAFLYLRTLEYISMLQLASPQHIDELARLMWPPSHPNRQEFRQLAAWARKTPTQELVDLLQW